MDREDITDLIDPLVDLARRVRAAEVDAACCQTKRDWERLHTLTDQYDELYEVTILKLGALALSSRRT